LAAEFVSKSHESLDASAQEQAANRATRISFLSPASE